MQNKSASLVFDSTCLYIAFNNLVDAVKWVDESVWSISLTQHETPTLRSVYTINIDL